MVAGIGFVDWGIGENTALYAKQCSKRCSLVATSVEGNENCEVPGQQRLKREALIPSVLKSAYSF